MLSFADSRIRLLDVHLSFLSFASSVFPSPLVVYPTENHQKDANNVDLPA